MPAVALVASLVLALSSGFAGAVRAPRQLGKSASAPLELAAPAARGLRVQRQVRWDQPPALGSTAWARFRGLHGQRWHALFDGATGTPLRIFGEGIAVPGACADAAVAERAARSLLGEQIELLAPGARPADFVVLANVFDARTGQRSIGLAQTSRGTRVLGGQVSFSFKNDRLFVIGSTAIPFVPAPSARLVDDGRARAAAAGWVARDLRSHSLAASGPVDGPFFLPLVDDQGVQAVRQVLRVTVASQAPAGRWSVYVDAATGEAVAREQTLRFADATVQLDVPNRWPENGRLATPARSTTIAANGASVTTDESGKFSFTGVVADLVVRMTGTQVEVRSDTGVQFAASASVNDGGSTTVGNSAERADAQVAAYVFAREAKDRGKLIAPQLAWLDTQELVVVNINETCNAFSDGDVIHFYIAGDGCANTGRLADVVHHETGHSIHNHAIIPGVGFFEGALSEGISDYLAATIVDDCGMGRGFFLNGLPLRDCDPVGSEALWPRDIGEIHTTGIIIAGALWDLRKNFIAELGQAEGVALADRYWYAILERAADIPSSYAEVLAADDDDGDLANGTPHQCAIDDAFARHGLVSAGPDTGPGVRAPTLTGLHLVLPIGPPSLCPGRVITGASVDWKLRDKPSSHGQLALVASDDGAGGSVYAGDLPAVTEGAVLNYQVIVSYADQSTIRFPENLADPLYEVYLGETVPIYCTDFETTDPNADGWSHGLHRGSGVGADDWTWGTPTGVPSSGDPSAAYSGANVLGNDLGSPDQNGSYQPDVTSFMTSMVIDTTGHAGVRLQYRRWLTVEDADFDKASIYADGQLVWQNYATGNMDGSTQHIDKEWRFHDVEVTDQAADGKVQLTFELASDGGLEFGGWNIDDLCVVGYVPPVCGDGVVTGVEPCDDGNDIDTDACTNECTLPVPVDPRKGDTDCGCKIGARTGAHAGTASTTLALMLLLVSIVRSRRFRRF